MASKERKDLRAKLVSPKRQLHFLNKAPLSSVLDGKDFDLIDELVAKCSKPNDISRKMDFFYGSIEKYHKLGDCQPILPLNFDTSENSNQNWGNLARVILENKTNTWNDLLKSVTGDINSKLKELCLKVQESKFRKVLKLIDGLLKQEMRSWEDKYKKPHENEEQKKLRSCITLLVLLNKGKLEDIIMSTKLKAKKNYAKNQFSRKIKILERNSNFDDLNFSRYFHRPSSKSSKKQFESKSSKTVPSLPMISPIDPSKVTKLRRLSKFGAKPKNKRRFSSNACTSQLNLDTLITEELNKASPNISYGRVFR